MQNNKKNDIDLTEKEEKIKIRDKYQEEIKLLFEEKKVIENEIKNISLMIGEKEAELKKINEKKHLYSIEREKIEKKEEISTLLDEKREIERNRWELEKKISNIMDIELKIGEVVFEKRNQLKEIDIQYNFIKEKILKVEKNLVLINNQIKEIDKEEIEKKKKEVEEKKRQEIEEKKKEEQKKEEIINTIKKEPLKELKKDKENNKAEDSNQKMGSIILTEKEKKDKIEAFFELFYQKIWLSVVTFDDNEKKTFKKIILSGGADFIPELREYIQKKINQKFPNVTVKIADPFINIDDSSLLKRPKKISQFSNAIGAALKGFKN